MHGSRSVFMKLISGSHESQSLVCCMRINKRTFALLPVLANPSQNHKPSPSSPTPKNTRASCLLQPVKLLVVKRYLRIKSRRTSSWGAAGWCDHTCACGSWWHGVEGGRSTCGRSSSHSCTSRREPSGRARSDHHADGEPGGGWTPVSIISFRVQQTIRHRVLASRNSHPFQNNPALPMRSMPIHGVSCPLTFWML